MHLFPQMSWLEYLCDKLSHQIVWRLDMSQKQQKKWCGKYAQDKAVVAFCEYEYNLTLKANLWLLNNVVRKKNLCICDIVCSLFQGFSWWWLEKLVRAQKPSLL